MKRARHLIFAALLCGLAWAQPAGAETVVEDGDAPPSAEEKEALAGIKELRDDLVDAFNKGDVDRMLSHLDEKIVVTWQNAEVSVGHDAVREYYERMMVGPDSIVKSLSVEPVIEGRHLYGDTSLSYGHMNDTFELREGDLEFTLDSRFSAALIRRDGRWLVKGFHASGDMFDNEIQSTVARRVAMWSGGIAAVVGALVGFVLAKLIGRRRSARAAGAGAAGRP